MELLRGKYVSVGSTINMSQQHLSCYWLILMDYGCPLTFLSFLKRDVWVDSQKTSRNFFSMSLVHLLKISCSKRFNGMYTSKTTLVSKLQPKNVYTQKSQLTAGLHSKNRVLWVDVSPFPRGYSMGVQLKMGAYPMFKHVYTCVYIYTYINI